MKSRIICALTFMFVTTVAFSQLKVISSGYVGIGSGASTPVCALAVGADNGHSSSTLSAYGVTGNQNRALRIIQPVDANSTSDNNYGIVSQIAYGGGGSKLYALYANAYRGTTEYNSPRTYGVLGLGGNGMQGYNYGVFGSIQGSRYGAAVYGSINQEEPSVAMTQQYAGYFNGDVYIDDELNVDGTTYYSDINLKKDIEAIDEDVLEKLAQLQTIRFKLKHYSEYEDLNDTIDMDQISREMDSEKYQRERFGLIAQELQTTFPEVVKEQSSGYLGVRYTELIPILVKAINQQQEQIESLLLKIEDNASDYEYKGSLNTTSVELLEEGGSATLQQNVPNPFNENTVIKYSVPAIESYAMINVYDLSGRQVKGYSLTQTGIGEIVIPASELDPGLFIYNLIVDGAEIDSKRMILTDL